MSKLCQRPRITSQNLIAAGRGERIRRFQQSLIEAADASRGHGFEQYMDAFGILAMVFSQITADTHMQEWAHLFQYPVAKDIAVWPRSKNLMHWANGYM
jgi:hypothetical protein